MYRRVYNQKAAAWWSLEVKTYFFNLFRFKSSFKSLYPDPDKVITIASKLHVTSIASIKLGLPSSKGQQDYTAEFTYDSASEFSVSPKTGKLEHINK